MVLITALAYPVKALRIEVNNGQCRWQPRSLAWLLADRPYWDC